MKKSCPKQLNIDLRIEAPESALMLLEGIDQQALLNALAELLLEALDSNQDSVPGEQNEH